jgi:predicted phage-related endonuclease
MEPVMGLTENLAQYREIKAEARDRRQFLGGSDIAAVLGVSRWQTPYGLYHEKTAQGPPQLDPEKEKFFRRRKMLEPVIIDIGRVEYGLDIIQRNQVHADPQYDWMRAEIDFEWRDDDGSIQNADAKSASPFTRDKWGIEQGDDEIPMEYTAQFLWGQMVTGRELTLCVTLIGTDDARIYRVKRDDSLIAHMRSEALKFWERVQERRPPPITTLADARLAFPRDAGSTVVANPEICEALQSLAELNLEIKTAEMKADELKAKIEAHMGTAAYLVDDQGDKLATWKTQQRAAYSVQAGESRVFRTY